MIRSIQFDGDFSRGAYRGEPVMETITVNVGGTIRGAVAPSLFHGPGSFVAPDRYRGNSETVEERNHRIRAAVRSCADHFQAEMIKKLREMGHAL